MQLNNNTTSYFYHRNSDFNVTIAYQRLDDGSAVYGAAFCRKGDQFSKRIGRRIAEGRMRIYEPTVSNAPTERWALHQQILDRLNFREFGYIPETFCSDHES